MKVRMASSKHGHWIELEAETLEEAAEITNFGINATQRIDFKRSSLSSDKKFTLDISFDSRKIQKTTIGKSNV